MSSDQVSHNFVHALKTSKKRDASIGWKLAPILKMLTAFFSLYPVWTHSYFDLHVLAFIFWSCTNVKTLPSYSQWPPCRGWRGAFQAVSSLVWTNLASSAPSHQASAPAPVWLGGSLLDWVKFMKLTVYLILWIFSYCEDFSLFI